MASCAKVLTSETCKASGANFLNAAEPVSAAVRIDPDGSALQAPTPVNWEPTLIKADALGRDPHALLHLRSASITGDLAQELESRLDAIPDDLILHGPASTESPSGAISPASTLVDGKISAQAPASNALEVECQVRARIPYPDGEFYLHLYTNSQDSKEHLAIVFGGDIVSQSLERPRGPGETEMQRRIRGARVEASHAGVDGCASSLQPQKQPQQPPPLVRIHSECFTGETVSSVRCDCGYQLAEAMDLIRKEGRGVIVYLRQEGRNIGLLEKLKAYNIQDMGHDTVTANLMLNHPVDARTYDAAQAILRDLGISELRLLTNNPDKIKKIEEGCADLRVLAHVPMIPKWWSSSDEGKDAPVGAQEDRDGISSHLSYSRHFRVSKQVMSEADKYLITKLSRMGHMLKHSDHL